MPDIDMFFKLLGICFWGGRLSQSLGRTGGRGKGGWSEGRNQPPLAVSRRSAVAATISQSSKHRSDFSATSRLINSGVRFTTGPSPRDDSLSSVSPHEFFPIRQTAPQKFEPCPVTFAQTLP